MTSLQSVPAVLMVVGMQGVGVSAYPTPVAEKPRVVQEVKAWFKPL